MIVWLLCWGLPLDTRRKLNVHRRFRIRSGCPYVHSICVLCPGGICLYYDIQQLKNSVQKKYLQLALYSSWHYLFKTKQWKNHSKDGISVYLFCSGTFFTQLFTKNWYRTLKELCNKLQLPASTDKARWFYFYMLVVDLCTLEDFNFFIWKSSSFFYHIPKAVIWN